MHRLAGVARIVTPDTEVADENRLAAPAVGIEPGAIFGADGRLRADGCRTPVTEILHQLLPAIDDGIGQVAGVVLRPALGRESGIVGFPRDRQGLEREHTARQPVVVDMDEVSGIALGIVRITGALRAIELAPQNGDVGDNGGRAQERRQFLGEILCREAAHELMAGCAPGKGGARAAERAG